MYLESVFSGLNKLFCKKKKTLSIYLFLYLFIYLSISSFVETIEIAHVY